MSSPLLEDINLQGAHGILVNVTAGMDLSIGEFQEVGNIVKQFASDDATVVVGTVIDPELSDEMRVTVVATGLGRPEVAAVGRSPYGRDVPTLVEACPASRRRPRNRPMRVVPRRPLTAADYAALDKPAVQRQRAVGDGLHAAAGIRGCAGYPGIPAAPGGLSWRTSRKTDYGNCVTVAPLFGGSVRRARLSGRHGA